MRDERVRRRVGLLVAALAGLLLFAAHPPFGFAPLAYGVAPLLIAALRLAGGGDPRDRATSGPRALSAFRLGLLAGSIGYGAMISWLIAPAGALGWALLVLVQAAWLGLWSLMIARWLRSPWLPVIGALSWVGMDMLRGLVPLSGFRWGALAESQIDGSWLLPIVRVLGASGATFIVVLVGIGLIEGLLGIWGGDRETPPRAPLVQAVGGALIATLITVGPPMTEGSLDVVVAQGNDVRHWVAQVPNPPLHITTNLTRLTLDEVERGGSPDLIVWPESAIDRDPSRPTWSVLGELATQAAQGSGARLVAGVSLDGPDDPMTERIVGAWLLGPAGTADVEDLYIKRRPVPFGEYVPGRRFMGWVPGIEQVPRDAIAGDGPQAFEVAPGVFAAVAVCFETLFSDIVRTNITAGAVDAGLVLAITNDASFQDSAEPAQHLAQSQIRAVETGRWVVHAALSGSSAFVDPQGNVHDATELFTATVIRRDVPLAAAPTPFLRLGDVLGVIGAFVLGGLLLLEAASGVLRRRNGRAGR